MQPVVLRVIVIVTGIITTMTVVIVTMTNVAIQTHKSILETAMMRMMATTTTTVAAIKITMWKMKAVVVEKLVSIMDLVGM
jgi:hypothetical protein